MSKTQELYLLITYQRDKNETDFELKFSDKDTIINILYNEKIGKSNKNEFRIILRSICKIKGNKKSLKFIINRDTYTISFDPKGKTFIYNLDLKKENCFYRNTVTEDQTTLKDFEKFNYFCLALANEKQELLLELYDNSIDLYGDKPSFEFLINLFVKVYKITKCSKLLDKFKNKLENEDQKNTIKSESLNKFKDEIIEICDNIENILKENKCNPVDFFGLILCYLNNYDLNKFSEIFRHVYAKDSQIIFEILLQYKSYLRNPINLEVKFLEEFICFSAGRTYNDLSKNALCYIKKLVDLLKIIDKYKDKIIAIEGFKPLALKKFQGKISINEIKEINELVQIILTSSEKEKEKEEEKKLLIFFDNNFWEYIINGCKNPTQDSIEQLLKIRENFKIYFDTVKSIYTKENAKKLAKGSILHNAKEFGSKNQIDFLLDKYIKEFINKKNDITNIEIISLIRKSDPYYFENVEEYINRRDVNILEKIDFQSIDDEFIKVYREYEFEIIFKKKIVNYLDILFKKVDDWKKFYYIVKIINEENIDNKNNYIWWLNSKYDELKKNKIPNEIFDKIVEILIYICDFMNHNNNEFYSTKINKLNDKKLKNNIYIGLLRYCNDDEHNKMKKFIEDHYVKNIKLENLNETIIFLKNLKTESFSDVMARIKNNYLINNEDFYSPNKNVKMELLLAFKNNNLFIEDNIYYDETKNILDNISSEINHRKISIAKLNYLLSDTNEDKIKEKLKLLEENDIDKYFDNLKNLNNEINNELEFLEFIGENLGKYHKEYEKKIEDIKKTITKIKNGTIIDYEEYINNKKITIDNNLEELAKTVNKVKNLLLFDIIFKCTTKTKEEGHFENAIKKMNNIKNILKEDINLDEEDKKIIKEIKSNNNSDIEKDIKIYFKDQEADNEISLVINSPNIEKDIKSIFYFFDKFGSDEKWNKILCPGYKNISEKTNEEKKKILHELNEKGIYNYLDNKSNKSYYIKFFNCLYNKEETFNFLLTHSSDDLKILYDKLDPNIQTLTPSDIEYTITCVNFFNDFERFNNDHILIFNYIKESLKDNENLIKSFERFSDIAESIMNMYQNIEISTTLYDEIEKKFKNAEFFFNRDNDEFLDNDKNKISFDELMKYKNKIRVQSSDVMGGGSEKIEKKEKNEDIENEEKIAEKNKLLLFFKELFEKIGLIHDNMEFLRKKGSVLDIRIHIKTKGVKVIYYLGNYEIDYNYIENYLSKVKNDILKKLDDFYKISDNMRFFYGRQICYIINHLNGYNESFSFLRYLLNDNFSESIKQGNKMNVVRTENYIKNYTLITKDSFNNICNYVDSLFNNNNLSLEKHYNKMKIINQDNSTLLKGLFIYKSGMESETMEKDILQIFLDKIGNLPIAQNILIFNKETSVEEMQAFLYRGILCKYNTIFVFEINDSFNENYQRYLNKIIDKILTYSNDIYNKMNKTKYKLEETSEYMKSCFIFIYNEKNESSLNQIINLYKPKEFNLVNKDHSISNSFIYDDLNKINYEKRKEISRNIHIIKSEICGLGKSFKIREDIEKNNKKQYIHFPIGGNISRNFLFQKLENIFSLIKNENYNYKNVAIHLDLYDNNETSILNEFLFSFLITKFYSNNENIIYIPKDLEIYIEVPNCFEDFISKYKILNAFHIENITLTNKPKLCLSLDKLHHFKNMIETNNIDKIEKYINNFFKIEDHSYHQLNIFINLFIGQYSKTNTKRIFYEDGEIVTEKVIKIFAESTKYFTSGGFSNLLVDKNNIINGGNNIIFKLLSEEYDKDIKNKEYQTPLIFRVPSKNKYFNVYLSKEKIDEEFNKKNMLIFTKYSNIEEYFLKKIKKVLDLKNPVTSKDDSGKKPLLEIIREEKYVITYDNFRKMMLIIYRIIAKLPVILMGETGCGKTALIMILNKLLYNDINDKYKHLEIINIHPGITDDFLIDEMNRINDIAENMNGDLWVFFDELNTCDSFALLTEIFINHSYDGKRLSNNIRLIGACNPYRLLEKEKIKCGLSHPNDIPNVHVYLVKILPQSLMYYIFNFGSLDKDDEKLYISSIISELFNNKESELKQATQDLIFQCHDFLRKTYDKSVVSLREMTRFTKCCKFFMDEYLKKKKIFLESVGKKYTIKNKKKEENFQKIKAIILSIYICYYTRLMDRDSRDKFDKDSDLKRCFVNLVDWDDKGGSIDKNEQLILKEIKNQSFRECIKMEFEHLNFNQFSDIIKLEQNFLINQLELGKGIGPNNSLRENLFLLFVSICTNIPLIIIGKPGSGKSLSCQIINNSMRGKFSENKFFKSFPAIIRTYFQGSKMTTPQEVENIFKLAEKKLESAYKSKNLAHDYISLIIFDELGLAERGKFNPLKVLHSKLDEYNRINSNEENLKSEKILNKNNVVFIGISNWSLDAAKLNRVLCNSVPDLDEYLDDLTETSGSIAESYSEYFKTKNLGDETNIEKKNIFDTVLPNVFFNYKSTLKELNILNEMNEKKKSEINNKKSNNQNKKIKIDFHGNRDFFFLIKGVAKELSENNEIDDKEIVTNIIEKYIDRNFGGTYYVIDIEETDLNIINLNNKEYIQYILDNYIKEKKNKTINSVIFYKLIHNYFCLHCEESEGYMIKKFDKYDIVKCIEGNIKDLDSRYLLLENISSLSSLVSEIIKRKTELNKGVFTLEGSPFPDDIGLQYQYRLLNIIQEHMKKNNLLIVQNLNLIFPFLYDVFNMNYIKKEGKNFARICHGNLSDQQLVYVNKQFRLIVLINNKSMNSAEPPFLNRFEKIKNNFMGLLEDYQIELIRDLKFNEFNADKIILQIENYNKKINYNIKELLFGCKEEDIQGLIYIYSMDLNKDLSQKDNNEKNSIKEILYEKLVRLMPQDIIINLPDSHEIYTKYFQIKKFYDLEDYINPDKNKEISNISIIYTFTNITENVPVMDENGETIIISEIKSENDFLEKIKNILDNKKKSNKKIKFIYLIFVQSESSKLSFIISCLNRNYLDIPIKFICIIHIKRNFNKDVKNKETNIYKFTNLDKNIGQFFIDNLKSLKENDDEKVTLKDLLYEDINFALKKIDLNSEFEYELKKFINSNLNAEVKSLKGENDFINNENYLTKLEEYFKKERIFQREIIDKAKSFIKLKGKDLIKKIYDETYINKNSVDIISIMMNYIKEKLFGNYLMDIFNNLEDNNIFTSLMILSNEKNEILSEDTIRDLQKYSLNDIKYKQRIYDPKFDLNFLIPGFYNSFEFISNVILTTVKDEYMKNENKLRYFFKGIKDNAYNEFIEKESFLIEKLHDSIRNSNIFNMMYKIKIPEELFLDDYITFYLNKYYYSEFFKNNSCYLSFGKNNHRLIKLLLKLRFRENVPIIVENKEDDFKLLLIKICWLESNIMYIIEILQIYSELKNIFNKEEDKLIELIENYSNSSKIHYITNEKRNPEVTTTVNECYYLILAYIIYSIVYPNVNLQKKKGFEITVYFDSIKGALKKIENLNDNLIIYLNEMYILGELLMIYETLYSNNKMNLELLNSISETLRVNIELIQEKEDIDNIIKNFDQLYEKITKNLSYMDRNYYTLLKYIFFNEIKKINDTKYRATIFEKLLKEKEVIMNSKDIYQILLKKLIPLKKKGDKYEFIKSIDYLLGDEGRIVPALENILKDNKESNNFVLTETLLYFFEKNSNIFIDRIMNEKNKNKVIMTLDNEDILNVFQKSIKFLDDYNNPKKYKDKNRNVCKLFCIGFIKTFCYYFINFLQNSNSKIENAKNIIKAVNESKTASKIITLYIYKIIYNINNKDTYLFSIPEIREKFKLEEYNSFKNVKIITNLTELTSQFNLDKKYEEVYNIVEKYNYDKFKHVNTNEFEAKEIDKFYFASSNLILSNLKIKDFYKSEIYVNLYKNVCCPLFNSSSMLFKAIRLFYDPEKYSKMIDAKEFQINNESLKPLLYSYRYFLNEIASDLKDNIFSPIYSKENNIKKFYFPGNDIRNLPIYEIYNKILNHFNEKPRQACFICMCDEGYYYSTRDEEPNAKDLNAKCQKCKKPMGTIKDGRRIIPIKRDGYFRVLTKEQYEYKYNREFSDYSFKTIQNFKDEYIDKKYLEEKGINKIEENHLKKDNKKKKKFNTSII